MYLNKHSALKMAVIGLLFFHLPGGGPARAETDAGQLFTAGRIHYAAGEYEAAAKDFNEALRIDPGASTYYHWLAKSYGRLAEAANLLEAYRLSQKTRLGLERAVELDHRNIDALADLIEFYRQAPAFLGGGREKAGDLAKRLDDLKNQVAGTP